MVSRRDRIDGCKSGYGGVVTLVREDVFNVVEIFKAENAERVSCTVHTNLGPVLLVNWYRPPDDEAYTSLPAFRDELADLNIHHRKWPNANTAAGRMLQQICENASLCQLVNEERVFTRSSHHGLGYAHARGCVGSNCRPQHGFNGNGH